MIEQKTPECILGLTIDTLSAWRDGNLRSDETQRIRAHTATCIACQQRLAGFAMVAHALGRQGDLEPGDRVWQAVQSRIAAHAAGRSDPMHVPAWNWRGLAAVASVILVVGLLAYVLSAGFSQRGGPTTTSTATVAPTPTVTTTAMPTLTGSTVVPGPQLSWRAVHPYPSGTTQPPAVAPGDGSVAYTFAQPALGGTQAQCVVTRDAGATWTAAGTFAVGSQPSTAVGAKPFELHGNIVVAANDPAIAVTSIAWLQAGANGSPSSYSNSVTFDYGAHWQALPGHATFYRLATYQGRIYAQRLAGGELQGGENEVLFVSTDHMATWQPIDGSPLASQVQAFWLNPSSGALLVDVYGHGAPSDLFYSSTDGGAHWTQLTVPQFGRLGEQWVVQAPAGNAPWRICGVADPISPDGSGVGAQPATMSCSTDGGQTWATRPALNLVITSGKGYPFFAQPSLLAIAGDGAVIATAIPAATEPTSHVYRLPAGATVWQDLGPLPQSNTVGLAFSPTSSGAVLWLTSSSSLIATYPPA